MLSPPAAVAASAPSQKLVNDADLFMHYSLVGNVKLAAAFGKAILKMSPSPVDALHAFEAAANGRNVSEILIDNQQVPALRGVSAQISSLLNKGHLAVARNPNRIMQAIAAMDQSPRAFVVSRERLRAAGEFAVPFYIHTLNSESQKALHPYVLQMMSDIGKPVINALVEQLATPSVAEKVQIIHVLGNIGYPQSLAYLKQIAEDKSAPADERAAAVSAIDKIDPTGLYSRLNAAQQYLWLAKGYFHHRPSLAPNYLHEATNPIWFYDAQIGDVTEVAVPTAIWYDVQCMRACKAALRLEPNLSPAISLWLTANLRREVDLPAGMTDPSLPKDAPSAAYYAMAAGPRYLNPSLREALAIDNSRLILKVVRALTKTGGVAGLVSSPASPLLQAMSYPDLQVRFEAAAALAAANPLKPYIGYDRVVPILSEALAQSGKPVCVVIQPSAQARNALSAGLRSEFHIIGASTTSEAFELARRSPIINLVVVQGTSNLRNFTQLAATDARLAYTPLVILAHTAAARADRVEFADQQTVTVLPVGSGSNEVQTAYQSVLDKLGGNIPPSLKLADALRAARQLKLIAMNRASIYSVLPALSALHAGLHNRNSKVVLAAAQALGRVRDAAAQRMLVRAALHSSGASADVRAALFESLAVSARNLGDDLTRGQVADDAGCRDRADARLVETAHVLDDVVDRDDAGGHGVVGHRADVDAARVQARLAQQLEPLASSRPDVEHGLGRLRPDDVGEVASRTCLGTRCRLDERVGVGGPQLLDGPRGAGEASGKRPCVATRNVRRAEGEVDLGEPDTQGGELALDGPLGGAQPRRERLARRTLGREALGDIVGRDLDARRKVPNLAPDRADAVVVAGERLPVDEVQLRAQPVERLLDRCERVAVRLELRHGRLDRPTLALERRAQVAHRVLELGEGAQRSVEASGVTVGASGEGVERVAVRLELRHGRLDRPTLALDAPGDVVDPGGERSGLGAQRGERRTGVARQALDPLLVECGAECPHVVAQRVVERDLLAQDRPRDPRDDALRETGTAAT
jgi:hypothetical protein